MRLPATAALLAACLSLPAAITSQNSTNVPNQPRQGIEGSIFRVWLDTDVWNQVNLIKQLNGRGKSKHIQFIAVDSDASYDYRIQYSSGSEDVPLSTGGAITGHNSSVSVSDASGRTIFQFYVADRFTEKGASNYAARVIVKRLAETWGR